MKKGFHRVFKVVTFDEETERLYSAIANDFLKIEYFTKRFITLPEELKDSAGILVFKTFPHAKQFAESHRPHRIYSAIANGIKFPNNKTRLTCAYAKNLSDYKSRIEGTENSGNTFNYQIDSWPDGTLTTKSLKLTKLLWEAKVKYEFKSIKF